MIFEQPDLSISELCSHAHVSTSGFYFWRKSQASHEESVEEDLVQAIFHARKGKVGARTIKMLLARQFWLHANLKKVRRIMKLHKLQAIIRRRNKYNNFSRDAQEHKTCTNHLQREFNPKSEDTVYSTDITYLHYGKGLKGYLSAIKDLKTKEIVHYRLSKSLNTNLATDGVADLLKDLSLRKRQNLIIHSDQGLHYTSRSYRHLLNELSVIQSMSRRGNCLDNAPIESFFGHMKDELDLQSCQRYEDLVAEVDRFIYYYNNERPQWGLKGKTPAECRGFS